MKKKQKPSALEPLVEFMIDRFKVPTKKEKARTDFEDKKIRMKEPSCPFSFELFAGDSYG